MKKLNISYVVAMFFFATIMMTSCSKEIDEMAINDFQNTSVLKLANATLSETFETGTKTSYAAADVTLTTGVWNINDALLGTTTSDRKTGTKSVRIQNTGKLTMKFNKTNGAGSVEIKHAVYGTDAASTWELYISSNDGSTWTKVGSTVTTSSTTLAAQTFVVNVSGNVRFEIRKMSGGTARLSIDDFAVSDYTTTGGGGSGGVATRDDNMGMGNPSTAVTNITYTTNYLMVKTEYTMSYNSVKRIPNWVSWHLSSAWLGTTPRQDNFRSDATLPSSWYKVVTSDYTNSGFDKGHMCPSADRNGSVADNSSTFLMTNMIPQAPKNNQITWGNLEDYSRSLVAAGNELYIISGPYGQGGTGSNGAKTTIGNSVVVPAKTWKIIVVLPNGSNDVSRITTSTRVIAVFMPNDQTCSNYAWSYYRTSVDQIETLTGYDFLSNVPTTVQNVIEASVDAAAIN